MKNNLFTKRTLLLVVIIGVVSVGLISFIINILKVRPSAQPESIAIKTVSSQIQVDGSVVAQDQAILHFQAPGKLVYLPFKEGAAIKQGQVVASLDTTTLQKQLTQSLNNYRSTRDTFDQTQQDQNNNVLQNQKKTTTGQNDSNYLNDIAKRIVDQNQATLDNAVINVEIAQQVLQLATITSPINGVVTHLDVTTPGVNITPATSFVVTDPSTLVFRTAVTESNIDYIKEGSAVTIKLGTGQRSISGIVDEIYPDKITLPSGQKAYQIDIQSPDLIANGKLGENGTALIQSNSQTAFKLVPTWTILNHNSIWVIADSKPVLRHITVGKTYGSMTAVLNGLEEDDQVITNPKSIAAAKYKIL